MIFDATQYSGKCDCGKIHKLDTLFCIIESGCLKKINTYINTYDMTGIGVAVYDENTYLATKDRHPNVDFEIILHATDLHANEYGVQLLLEKLPEKADYLIAIGSGTIHDIVRYCAYQRSIDFVSCPTAASVDGFCSSVAAMTWHGYKKTLTAVSPKIVVADLDIIKDAPIRLTKSGFGDMVGKYVALADWKIGNILTGEPYCNRISQMTMDAVQATIDSVSGLVTGSEKAYETLVYGLLLSGLAMQMNGNSRPASGAEHHISHLIEMQPQGLGIRSDALHGEKVGVATLIVAKEYHRIKANKNISWGECCEADEKYIKSMFGNQLGKLIIEENYNSCTAEISFEMIENSWREICDIIDTVPKYDELIKKYNLLEAKCELKDIGVPEEKCLSLLEYSPLIRNRLTLMRLCRAIKR